MMQCIHVMQIKNTVILIQVLKEVFLMSYMRPIFDIEVVEGGYFNKECKIYFERFSFGGHIAVAYSDPNPNCKGIFVGPPIIKKEDKSINLECINCGYVLAKDSINF